MPHKATKAKAGPTTPANSRYRHLQSADASDLSKWDVDPTMVGEAVLRIVGFGDAILFGLTSDGGALRITIFDGDHRHNLYASGPEEVSALLDQVAKTGE